MKILRHEFYTEEPFDCMGCREEWNGFNHIKLELFSGLVIEIELCEDCYRKIVLKLSSELKGKKTDKHSGLNSQKQVNTKGKFRD